jgi:hypothetical protein
MGRPTMPNIYIKTRMRKMVVWIKELPYMLIALLLNVIKEEQGK